MKICKIDKNKQTDEVLIRAIQELLDKAKEGELTSIAFVAEIPDGRCLISTTTLADPMVVQGSLFSLMSKIEMLSVDLDEYGE